MRSDVQDSALVTQHSRPARNYCECGRAIRVMKKRKRGQRVNYNNFKPTKGHDLCWYCWRRMNDRNRNG